MLPTARYPMMRKKRQNSGSDGLERRSLVPEELRVPDRAFEVKGRLLV